MFIYHEKQPFWFDGRYIYGVKLDAMGYKIDDSKANDVPRGYDCTYTHNGICAVLGIVRQEVLNKRTGKVETTSNKVVQSNIENPTYKFGKKEEKIEELPKDNSEDIEEADDLGV